MKRRSPLGRDPAKTREWQRRSRGSLERALYCDFDLDASGGHPQGGRRFRCARCERPWIVYGAGDPPENRPCPGLRQTGGPAPVSDRREEKRKARKVRGPLQEAIRGSPCVICGAPGDPAHVETVGAGHGDLVRRRGRWIGRIAPLCRRHHRAYDEYRWHRKTGCERTVVARAAREAGEAWMEMRGVDRESEEHPYVQVGWSR